MLTKLTLLALRVMALSDLRRNVQATRGLLAKACAKDSLVPESLKEQQSTYVSHSLWFRGPDCVDFLYVYIQN